MKASVCGFYGYKNYGDSLMRTRIQEFLLNHGVDPVFFSDRASDEALDYKQVDLLESEIVILGGGGIITEGFWFFKQGLFEKLTNQKFILLNVGLTQESVPVLEKIKDRVDLIVVRDKFSLRLAREHCPKVIYVPDITYLESSQSEKKNNIAVCLNYYIFGQFFSQNRRDAIFAEKGIIELSYFLDWVIKEGYSVSFVPCQTDNLVNDNTVNSILHGFLKKGVMIYDNSQIENVISSSSLLVSSRYHSSLFALKSKIPFIDITHHSKNLNFLNDVGLQEFSVTYWKLELEALKEKFRKVMKFDKLNEFSDQYGVYCIEGWSRVGSSLLEILK